MSGNLIWKGLWFAIEGLNSRFVIVNLKGEGRMYDPIEKAFNTFTIQFNDNGNYREISLMERKRGDENKTDDGASWPTLTEENLLFIES